MTKEKLMEILNERLTFLAYVQTNWTIWKGLTEAFKDDGEYKNLLKISPCFWKVTYNNLLSEALIKLAKLYDERQGSMGLNKIINICEQNQKLFPDKHVYYLTSPQKRKKYEYVREVDMVAILQSNREKYNFVQQLNDKLVTLRDKYLAHSDKKYLLDVQTLYQSISLKHDDIDKLISVAADILNSFLSALDNRVVNIIHTNVDDYKNILYYASAGKESQAKKKQ